MIKYIDLGIEDVNPYWAEGINDKPLFENHKKIINNPFPIIVFLSKPNMGKSTAAIYLLRDHFLTNKTKLVIFSDDLESDKKNKNAFDDYKEAFNNVVIHKSIFDKNGDNLIDKYMDEGALTFAQPNKFKVEYPRLCLFIDDLPESELRSSSMELLFRNARHKGIMCLVSIHDPKLISPLMRHATSLICVFGGMGNIEIKNVYDWVGPPVDLKQFIKIYKEAVSKHRFLMINRENKEMRAGLNKKIDI